MQIIPAKYLSNLRQVAPLSLLLLAACSSGGGDSATPPLASSFTIGGTISGLTGSGLVLRNNGGDDLVVAANSTTYTFGTAVANGGSYNVTVLKQPTGQLCSVANASGANLAANVTNANVTCVAAFTIGGTITGAANGVGPVLQNNGGDNLLIPELFAASGVPFTFSMPVADGGNYNVTQLSSTPIQTCSNITAGSGVVATGNVTGVNITCALTVPIPRFAYVTNGTANSISAYSIDNATGVLTAVGAPVATGINPHAVAVESGGRFAYVANTAADTISAYSIARAGVTPGALTVTDANGAVPGAQASIATGDEPFSITVHPSGKFAYVVNQAALSSTGNSVSAFSIDVTTGALAAIDADGATAGTQATIATGTTPFAVVIDPTGKFAYVANYGSGTVSVYTIDQVTGALAAGALATAGNGPSAIAIDPTGKCAIVANNVSGNVMSFTINATTGEFGGTAVSTVPANTPRGVAIDPSTGLFAYVANTGGGSVAALSVNPADCAIASIDTDAVAVGNEPTIGAGAGPVSVNVDPSGQYVYVANGNSNNVSAYRINGVGALTPLSTSSFAAESGPTSVTTTQ